MKIANHTAAINNMFVTAKAHPNPSGVVVLGMEQLNEVSEIKATVEQCDDLTLESYFSILSQVMENLERLMIINQTNLGNPALVRHLKRVTNTTLVDTKVLPITNAYLDRFWPGGTGEDAS